MRHLQKITLGSIVFVVVYIFVGSLDISEYKNHHRAIGVVSGSQEFLTSATVKR